MFDALEARYGRLGGQACFRSVAGIGAAVDQGERRKVSETQNQIGGDHYRKMAIQPIEYILANDLGFVEGAVVEYVSRWQSKGGVEDLQKARHLLALLIEHEEGRHDER